MKPNLRAWALAAAAASLLLVVFLAYLNPHRMVELANTFWACF